MRYLQDRASEASRLRALLSMTPERRLMQALELSEMTRRIFKEGLRRRYPDLSESQLHELFCERLELCHNKPY
jgi:hypothetical protein